MIVVCKIKDESQCMDELPALEVITDFYEEDEFTEVSRYFKTYVRDVGKTWGLRGIWYEKIALSTYKIAIWKIGNIYSLQLLTYNLFLTKLS